MPRAVISAICLILLSFGAPLAAANAPRSVSEDNAFYTFDYSYPAEAAAIPALRALLERDLSSVRARLSRDARTGSARARRQGIDFNKYDYTVGWQVVADLPGWLSLSANVGGSTGGAHPNGGFDAMVWDKTANMRRKASDLFASPAALSRAIREDFCREIDKQRAENRGAPVNRASGDLFDECIDPVQSTVILGSSNRRTFDRIGVLVAPYAAGPYVEGDYEVTLPVTAAVLAAVKPEFRSAFSIKR